MNGTTNTVALSHSADDDGPQMPQPTPDNPFPTPFPTGPTYSALDLLGEVYLGLWGAGKIPPGPMPDPEAAQRACAVLLRAFGVTPTGLSVTDLRDARRALELAYRQGAAET